MRRCRQWLFVTGFLKALIVVFFTTSILGSVVRAEEEGALVRPPAGNSGNFNPLNPVLRLFGAEQKKKKPARTTKKRNRASASYGNKKAVAASVKKDPDADIILVFGDRMAKGVAGGLAMLLSEKTTVRVVEQTAAAKALAGSDLDAMKAELKQHLSKKKVKVAVLMLGQHDVDKKLPSAPDSELPDASWGQEYSKRVHALVKIARDLRKPVIWVGLPPTSKTSLNDDFLYLNKLYRSVMEKSGNRYIDIWSAFLSEDAAYSSYGPDVRGKKTRLRTADKIGFTRAGYEKVAFFIERSLSRLLGGYGGTAFEGVKDDLDFMVLTGRSTSSEDLLLGGPGLPWAQEEQTNIAKDLFVNGKMRSAPEGRVDYTR